MTHSADTKSQPINLREGTGYLFILALTLFAIAAVWMLGRMFQPRGDWHSLAAVSELSIQEPMPFPLDNAEGTPVHVWLVFYDGTWRAYDGVTPTYLEQNCSFAWQPVTGRFEDPCSGAKFDLEGKLISNPYYPTPLATNLVQYKLELRGEQFWVNLGDKVYPSPAR